MGTTKLVPIGRRPLPSQQEIDNNPLWQRSPADDAYDRRRQKELRRHRDAVKRHKEYQRRKGNPYYPHKGQ